MSRNRPPRTKKSVIESIKSILSESQWLASNSHNVIPQLYSITRDVLGIAKNEKFQIVETGNNRNLGVFDAIRIHAINLNISSVGCKASNLLITNLSWEVYIAGLGSQLDWFFPEYCKRDIFGDTSHHNDFLGRIIITYDNSTQSLCANIEFHRHQFCLTSL